MIFPCELKKPMIAVDTKVVSEQPREPGIYAGTYKVLHVWAARAHVRA